MVLPEKDMISYAAYAYALLVRTEITQHFSSRLNVKFAGVISPHKKIQILDAVHNLCKI